MVVVVNDWFRSWHGAPTDPKWLVIAKRAGVAPYAVSAFAWALFDHASQSSDRGCVSDFDFETYAELMGIDEALLQATYQAMEAKGIIADGRLAKWDKRQPRREDDSAERVKAFRARNKGAVQCQSKPIDDVDGIAQKVCDVLKSLGPQPDDAALLHDEAERALIRAGLNVEREFAIDLDDGRRGFIDLVVGGSVAIELDRRLPRAKSLKKLSKFNGFKIAVIRSVNDEKDFLDMVDAVIPVPPLPITPPKSEITDQAKRISREITIISGRDPDMPDDPRWFGSNPCPSVCVQGWINRGFVEDIILESVRAQMARKTGPPPGTITYFEAGIRDAHTSMTRPIRSERSAPSHKPQKTIMSVIDGMLSDVKRDGDRGGESPSRMLPDGRSKRP